MFTLHSSAAIRAALSGICFLLVVACATNGNDVATSYKSVNTSFVAGTSSYRVGPTFLRVAARDFTDAVQKRAHEDYRVLGRSEFTSATATPLRGEAIEQGMHVGASVVIYSIEPVADGSQSRHKVVFMRRRGSSSGR